MSTRIGISSLAKMCRRAGVGLRAGVDILKVREQEANHGPMRQREQMRAVRERIMAGEPVAEAMSQSNGYFPPLACEMIDVGEQTGRVDEAFLRLAEHYEHVIELRRQFLTGIAWPLIQLAAGIAIVGFLILILGMLVDGEMAEQFDPFGFGLGFAGVVRYIIFLAVVGGSLTWLVMAVQRGWFGFDRLLHYLMVIPLIGTAFQTMALSRMSWTLGMGLNAGVDARRAIRMALRSTQSPYYRRHIPAVDQAIIAGREFHEALRPTGVFPGDFLNSLEAAELSGTGAESLERMAQEYQERAKVAMRMLTMVASFAIWGLIAMILVYVIFKLAMIYIGQIYDALDMAQTGRI
ncbi:MAG: type II secretion system F family protein [Planctomycetales bacterium]|nr:type II secretion system F family protein [Planctomycetales bacterium]